MDKGLKSILKSGSLDNVLSRLDRYLLSLQKEDNDRVIDVNAPSMIGTCPRSRYYARTGSGESEIISPRTQRIFDNGTYFHIRMQKYLEEAKILLMDEVPVLNEKYNIQGHTDGILSLDGGELAILELKSMNDYQFSGLKKVRGDHEMQGLIYLFCLEERRKNLQKRYKDFNALMMSSLRRWRYYASFYQHLKGGRKHTKFEKIKFQVNLHMELDCLLFNCKQEIRKVVFIYEDKNNQELKEFVVDSHSDGSKECLDDMIMTCSYLNKRVVQGTIPDRAGSSKSCEICRFCNYKSECWVV